jgi:hypothetical protein
MLILTTTHFIYFMSIFDKVKTAIAEQSQKTIAEHDKVRKEGPIIPKLMKQLRSKFSEKKAELAKSTENLDEISEVEKTLRGQIKSKELLAKIIERAEQMAIPENFKNPVELSVEDLIREQILTKKIKDRIKDNLDE